MTRRPQPLGELLPGVVADLARRHGHHPPTTLTDRNTDMTDPLICDICNEPMDNNNEGPRAPGVDVCVDCASLAEVDEDGAA